MPYAAVRPIEQDELASFATDVSRVTVHERIRQAACGQIGKSPRQSLNEFRQRFPLLCGEMAFGAGHHIGNERDQRRPRQSGRPKESKRPSRSRQSSWMPSSSSTMSVSCDGSA